MNQSFPKSLQNYSNFNIYPELSTLIKHNFKINKPENLILLNSKQNPSGDFDFKYTSERNLAKVVKNVRRRRQKQQDEDDWKLFNEKKQLAEVQEQEQLLIRNRPTVNDVGSSQFSEFSICRNKLLQERSGDINSEECDRSHTERSECKPSDNEINDFQINNIIFSSESNFYTKTQTSTSHELLEDSGHFTNHEDAKTEDYVLKNKTFRTVKSQVSEPLSIGVLKKMEDLVMYINKIGMILSTNQSEPVDSDIAERNLKRNTEFTTLFARNYLYRVQRQKKEAKKIFTGGFPLPQQKLATMYQTALNALQVYERHLLKSSAHTKCIQQLEQIFDFIIYLITLTEKVTGGDNFVHRRDLIEGSKQLKNVLFECSKENVNIPPPLAKKPTDKSLKVKRKTQDKLSMYASKPPKPFWKKASAKLARAKFGLPSAHKSRELKKEKEISESTTVIKHNKEMETKQSKVTFEEEGNTQDFGLQNQQVVENEIKLKKSFRQATRAVPEEEVVSMMEILCPQFNDETDEDEIKSLSSKHMEDSVKVRPSTTETPLHNLGSRQLTEATKCFEAQKSTCAKMNSNPLWPKNIQMVYIKAEDEENKILGKPDSTLVVPNEESKNTSKRRLIVTDADRNIALEYKNKCSELAESAPCYEDGNKPWDIVSRISDEMTLDILESVCQSLEIDIVIQKLYDLEFR